MRDATEPSSGYVTGGVQVSLRLEGLAAFVGAVAAYHAMHGHWLWFFVLFLAPDLSFLGYAVNPRVGAAVYDGAHTYVCPAILLAVGLVLQPALVLIALVWIAHIGLDRALGYGLKYAPGFTHTHLGRIGPSRQG